VGLGQLHLRVDVFVLILDDLDIVFSRPLVVLDLSFLRFKFGLVQFKFLHLLLKLRDRLNVSRVLIFEHLLSLRLGFSIEVCNYTLITSLQVAALLEVIQSLDEVGVLVLVEFQL